MSLLLHGLHNIFKAAIESHAYLQQNIRGDILALAQFGDGGGADARYASEVLSIHAFVDQELPQPVITDSHIHPRYSTTPCRKPGRPSVSPLVKVMTLAPAAA